MVGFEDQPPPATPENWRNLNPHSPVILRSVLFVVVPLGLWAAWISSIFKYDWFNLWRDNALVALLSFPTFFAAGPILMTGALVYMVLSRRNGRPSLKVPYDSILPGQILWVTWTIAGNPERLRRLEHVTLELQSRLVGRVHGRDHAGNETVEVQRHVLATLPLESVGGKKGDLTGIMRVRVPQDAPKSDPSAGQIGVEWVLKIEATGRFWPKISDEFRVRIGSWR